MLLFYSIVIQLWVWEFIAVLWLAEWEAAEYRNFPFNVQLYDRKKIYVFGFRPSLPNILKKRLVLLRHCTWFISMSSISDWVLCFGRNKCSILKGYFQLKVSTRVKKYLEDNFISFYLVLLWPSPPGTFHVLVGKFSYFVIRFLNNIFFCH